MPSPARTGFHARGGHPLPQSGHTARAGCRSEAKTAFPKPPCLPGPRLPAAANGARVRRTAPLQDHTETCSGLLDHFQRGQSGQRIPCMLVPLLHRQLGDQVARLTADPWPPASTTSHRLPLSQSQDAENTRDGADILTPQKGCYLNIAKLR